MATVFTAVRGAGPGALDDALALHSAVWAASAHHALVGTIGADKSKAWRAAHDQAAGLPGGGVGVRLRRRCPCPPRVATRPPHHPPRRRTRMTEPLRTLTVDVDGGIHARTVKGPLLQHLYTEIGCERVDCVALTVDLDIWVDDEGLLVDEPRVNHGATAIAAAYGITWQPYVGTVVFTGGADDDGETLGLTAEQIKQLRHAAVQGYCRAIASQVTYVGDLPDR